MWSKFTRNWMDKRINVIFFLRNYWTWTCQKIWSWQRLRLLRPNERNSHLRNDENQWRCISTVEAFNIGDTPKCWRRLCTNRNIHSQCKGTQRESIVLCGLILAFVAFLLVFHLYLMLTSTSHNIGNQTSARACSDWDWTRNGRTSCARTQTKFSIKARDPNYLASVSVRNQQPIRLWVDFNF